MFAPLIKKIAWALDLAKIPYMIIGGQAVLLYGTPRFTRDVDITLGVDTDTLPTIKKVCKKLGLKILPKNAKNFVDDTRVLPAEDIKSNIRIDFIFSFSIYEGQAIKNAKKVFINNYAVHFASPEDIIIHKLIAARAIDIEDVKNLLTKNRGLDIAYIRKWLNEFEQTLSQPFLKRFNQMWQSK